MRGLNGLSCTTADHYEIDSKDKLELVWTVQARGANDTIPKVRPRISSLFNLSTVVLTTQSWIPAKRLMMTYGTALLLRIYYER